MEPKWNVKVCIVYVVVKSVPVLMEPKWNVKFAPSQFFHQTPSVLMEPKWNIKDHCSSVRIPHTNRINGTKVECKGTK